MSEFDCLLNDRSQTVAQPFCPLCGFVMLLVLIEPYKTDYDSRTFECRECDYRKTVIVKYK